MTGRKYRQIVFEGMAFHGKYAWFCHLYYNVLCKLNLETNEITVETFFPTEESMTGQYMGVSYYHEKLIFQPLNAKQILIYELNSRQFKKIPLSLNYMPESNSRLFSDAILSDDKIFLFPGYYKSIVELNLSTLEIAYHNKWYHDLQHVVSGNQILFACAIRTEKDVLLPFRQGNKIVQMHLETSQFNIYDIGDSSTRYSGGTFDGKYVWLTDYRKSSLYKWIPGNDILEEYTIRVEGLKINGGMGHLVKASNAILLFPVCGNMIVKFEPDNRMFSTVVNLEENSKKEIDEFQFFRMHFSYVNYYENKIYSYSYIEGCIYCIDLIDMKVKKIQSLLNGNLNFLKKQIAQTMNLQRKCPLWEQKIWNLEIFISIIKEFSEKSEENEKFSRSGYNIYQLIDKQIKK